MARATTFYDFTLGAGETQTILAAGSYYKILSCSGIVEVRRDGGSRAGPLSAGQGERDTEFLRLDIRDMSGAANSGFIVVSDGDFVDDQLALSASALASLSRPEVASNSYCSASAAIANTAIAIITPATNVNGMIVQHVSALDCEASGAKAGGFVARAVAPTGLNNASTIPICSLQITAAINGYIFYGCELKQPVYVPSGNGLYYIQDFASAGAGYRQARVKLL